MNPYRTRAHNLTALVLVLLVLLGAVGGCWVAVTLRDGLRAAGL